MCVNTGQKKNKTHTHMLTLKEGLKTARETTITAVASVTNEDGETRRTKTVR